MADALGFISDVYTALPKSQLSAIQSLLEEKRRLGFFNTRESLVSDLKSKILDVKNSSRAFKFIPVVPGQTISSDFINSLFESIKIDLSTLYSQINVISGINSSIKAVTNDDFIKSKSAIFELITQLRLYRLLKLNPEYQDAKYVDFINAINRTSYSPKATVDINTKILKLPPSDVYRYSISRFNLDRATASLTIYGGGIESPDDGSFSLENTLDSNPDNFFAKVVLTDNNPYHIVSLSHSYPERLIGSGIQKGNSYISNGIVCAIEYNFSKSVQINNVKLLPIADYPLYILDIAYKTSDQSTDWITVDGFNPSNYDETLDWIEWIGNRFICSHIRIVLEQSNFTSNIYHIPSDLIFNNQLWHQIIDGTFSTLLHNIEIDNVIADKIALDPKQLAYLNELNDLGIDVNRATLDGSDLQDYNIINSLQKITASHMGKANQAEAKSYVNTYNGQELVSTSSLVEIRKHQYILGLRLVEFNDVSYELFGYYESQKFESNANILEVSLDTDELHLTEIDSITSEKFKKSSIEYELELSDKVVLPIAPISNIIETTFGKAVKITDEVLITNRQTYQSIVRFPVPTWVTGIPSVQVRRNGRRVSPLVINSGYGGNQNEYNYTISLTSKNNYNYITITFNSKYYNPRSIYTINYIADQSSSIVNINDILDSDTNYSPETFTSVDRDNKVVLNYYPYIEYSIVNDTGVWSQQDPSLQEWTFIPSILNYSIGRASISPSDSTKVNGQQTNWATMMSSQLTGSYLNITGCSIRFIGDSQSYRISSISNDSGLTTSLPINTGFLYGSPATGLPYVIGKTDVVDSITYGLNNNSYEPITVYVNDVKAINKTDYTTLEHGSFNPHDNTTRIYEYIQAGKNIYFNAPVEGKIEVYYRFLTKYIKLNAILRSHKIYNPSNTPILTKYSLLIKNSKI